MSIRLGICGAGSFARSFIPLFKAHPLVREVLLCDQKPGILQSCSKKYGITKTCSSLDELVQSDVDAIAIFTQNWLHGPQAIQALKAGKHVYSAVPSAITLEEITALVRTVEQTGKIYMIGETSYYYPCAIYCRDRFQKGDFGKIVYGEGEYYHDFDHGLYDVMKRRGGDQWKNFAGCPPMYYPTHSTSMIVSVTGAHATHVSCLGFVDDHADGLFRNGVNIWNNTFSNQTALLRMSDGSMARINEFRRIGHPGGERLSLYGTQGCYEEQTHSKIWTTKERANCTDLSAALICSVSSAHGVIGIDPPIVSNVAKGSTRGRRTADKMSAPPSIIQHGLNKGAHQGMSSVHPVASLPKEFAGLPNGHEGSHQFLVNDFVNACSGKKDPPNDVWAAARYLIPGLIAHQSALQGGAMLEIPDLHRSTE